MAAREPLPPPPPRPNATDPQSLARYMASASAWLERVYRRIDAALQIAWGQLDTAGSALADLESRPHGDLADAGVNSHAQVDGHLGATSDVHGASGGVVGRGDAATTGTPGVVRMAASVADATAPDAADLAGAIALVNELKTRVNDMLATERAAGQRNT